MVRPSYCFTTLCVTCIVIILSEPMLKMNGYSNSFKFCSSNITIQYQNKCLFSDRRNICLFLHQRWHSPLCLHPKISNRRQICPYHVTGTILIYRLVIGWFNRCVTNVCWSVLPSKIYWENKSKKDQPWKVFNSLRRKTFH